MYKIKIFSDGAEKDSLLKMNANPLISGMTTNPSLMKKAGITDYLAFSQDILKSIHSKPLSLEVFADDLAGMETQARRIAALGKNVYVKIPVQNTQGESTLGLVRRLNQEGVKINVTAIYTVRQTVESAKALENGAPSIVSVFAGRAADLGHDPVPVMKAAAEVCSSYGDQIESLWASTREVYNVLQAEQLGIKIITVPFDLITKLEAPFQTLESLSLDTVRTFKKDSDAAGFSF